MNNISLTNHARKLKKRIRRNQILQDFREPSTYKQAQADGISRSSYTNTVRKLVEEGYIKNAGVLEGGYNDILWQAIKFDYREEGIDYDNTPPKIIEEKIPPYIGLGQAVYVHNSSHAYLQEKYRAQSKKTREDKKKTRVWPGIVDYA